MDIYCPKCHATETVPLVAYRLYCCRQCNHIFYSAPKAIEAGQDALERMTQKYPMQRNRLTLELTHQLYPEDDPIRFGISLGDCEQDGLGVLWADLLAVLESWLDAPEKFKDAIAEATRVPHGLEKRCQS